MAEKKLYLYLRDIEYGKRLLRYINSHGHTGVRVEMVTEREGFWESRGHENHKDRYWLTDDVAGRTDDPGGGESLWFLTDRSDRERHRIGYGRKAEEIIRELMEVMELSGQGESPSGAPPPGVYGVYAPGEEASVTAALLSQELGEYGSCLYVNLREFPCFYESGEKEDSGNLSELFFRLELKDYNSLVRQVRIAFGKAGRLPAVSHYRDLWDISDEDRGTFFRRLREDCGLNYIVVLFNDVREAMPMATECTVFFTVGRPGWEEAFFSRWKRYERTERGENSDAIIPVVMPEGWQGWIREMENSPPEEWLRDADRQRYIRSIREEVR